MKLGLIMKQAQILAPQLIQSLKMLQMPILQLEQTLRHELQINPLLEEVDPTQESSDQLESDVEIDLKEDEKEIDPRFEKIDWESYFSDELDEGYRAVNTYEGPSEDYDKSPVMQKTLYDHLYEQLMYLKLSESEQLIGEYIIGNISSPGYLVVSPEEMAGELNQPIEVINKVLSMIKRFDPPGVASRDLRESLLLQLEEKGYKDSIAYRIVDKYINVLDRKSILQISRLMSIPLEKAQQAMDLIKTLSPTPAHGRFESGAAPIIPDLIVEKIGDKYVVFHNDRSAPRLRINPNYKQLMRKSENSSSDTKKYVREKLEQARWLLNSINQRRSTMIRVMEAIVDEQHEFFDKGPAFLKPLIMEDIARKVEMNVATISRVSNGKYVQTPQGVYEIKYFFNAGIANDEGGETSKRHVKNRLEEIIKAEDPQKPLSDQEIYRRLQDEGIKLARRTVTKYREELKILPARFRKRVGK